MRFVILAALAVALLACGGYEAPTNACATPARVFSCDEQTFFTFSLASSGSAPTWVGSSCDVSPCVRGDSCEARLDDGTFAEGVCE